MSKTLASIRQSVRQILLDEPIDGVTADFEDDEIDEAVLQCVGEASDYDPYIAVEALVLIASSRVLDIGSISGLRRVQRLEYPTGKNPREFKNFKPLDSETIEIDTTLTPTAGASGTLTGTITFTTGSAAVSGSGSTFATELAADYFIQKSTGSRWYRIASVTDATNLVLAEPVRSEDTGADTADVTKYCYGVALVYCEKDHELSDTKSTLPPQMERVLIDGAVANCAINWVNNVRGQITEAIGVVSNINSAVTDMGARITQSIADLTAGREYIGNKMTEALAAIGDMESTITRAAADLVAGRALIGDKRDEVVTAMALVAAEVAQAIADLDSGRTQIDDERTTANTTIDSITTMIAQAQADLVEGRTLINKITIGQNPQTDYGNSAARELQMAGLSLSQAAAYLSEASSSARFAQYASADLQAARGYIDEAMAYMAMDNITTEHANMAARELQLANTQMGQARAYLSTDAPATEFANSAARELANANSYLGQSGGFLRELSGRLNIAGAINQYRAWANERLAVYKGELPRLAKPKTVHRYAKG